MNPTPGCACGTGDVPGVCRHCDRPGECPTACVRCHMRDSYCAICHVDCETPTGGRSHEVSCRQSERQREERGAA